MEPLCNSCQYGHHFVRANGVTTTRCTVDADTILVPGDIVTCSKYHHAGQPDQWDLEKIAWVLRTDRTGKPVGFERPKKKDE